MYPSTQTSSVRYRHRAMPNGAIRPSATNLRSVLGEGRQEREAEFGTGVFLGRRPPAPRQPFCGRARVFWPSITAGRLPKRNRRHLDVRVDPIERRPAVPTYIQDEHNRCPQNQDGASLSVPKLVEARRLGVFDKWVGHVSRQLPRQFVHITNSNDFHLFSVNQ